MDTRLTFLPGSSAFSLPGAWPSTDSLEETLNLPNANPLKPRYIVPGISYSEGIKPSASNAAGERSSRNSVATCDDDSDDFYSFVETQDDDVEAASSPDPGDILPVPIKIENGGYIISENPGAAPTSPDPTLEHTDDTSSDDTSSFQKMSASSAPSDESNCTPQSDYSYPYSPTLLPPFTKDAGPTPRASLVTSSSRSVNSESSSGSGSARLGDEEFSHHLGHSEDESTMSHTRMYGVIDQVHFSNNSEESHFPSSLPRARRSLRRVVVNQDSQLDILHLAQPDGHNPWTLSLDPALVNVSEFATASRTSVSVESSSIAHVSPSISLDARLQTPVPPQTPTAPQSFSVAQGDLRSTVGLRGPSVDLLPPHYAAPSLYSAFTIPHPPEKKDVTQKPKTFYQKMKRFFTPRSSKRNESMRIANELPMTTPINSSFASQWSLNRHAFQRRAKSSALSVAPSYASDIPYTSTYRSAGVTQETRRTFEYRRSSTPEMVKSHSKRNRRFSVPTPFYAPSLTPSAPSSLRNTSVPSSRATGKRWSQIGEAEH